MNYTSFYRNPLILAIASLLLFASFVKAQEIQIVEDAPTNITLDLNKGFQQANLNLKIFASINYIVALILLISAGFNEMYLKNETFGERPFEDYFSLLAWGFGAEASREAIALCCCRLGFVGFRQKLVFAKKRSL
ncbi:MAG: hypothetical protein AAF383_20310 [Cyanobacteria bacterium P01_A01_bin.83]